MNSTAKPSTVKAVSTGNTTSTSKQVLVIDSGVGGLSICREIIACQAGLQLVYIADNAGFPYGVMEKDELVDRVTRLTLKALESFKADAIVVACNTASTVALPVLRQQLDIPVVGVVPAIKTAANLSASKTIGLLATQGTVQRDYTRELIKDFADDCKVISVGSSILVEHIEAHIYGEKLDQQIISSVLQQFYQHPHAEDIDTIVLGCTHFPLISDTLQSLQPGWRWIDSGCAIASRVLDILDTRHNSGINPPAPGNTTPLNRFFYTEGVALAKQPGELLQLANYIDSMEFGNPQLLTGL